MVLRKMRILCSIFGHKPSKGPDPITNQLHVEWNAPGTKIKVADFHLCLRCGEVWIQSIKQKKLTKV
jgi:hypothetical protein